MRNHHGETAARGFADWRAKYMQCFAYCQQCKSTSVNLLGMALLAGEDYRLFFAPLAIVPLLLLALVANRR